MPTFPDLKLLAEAKSLDVPASAISQFSYRLLNVPESEKTSEEYNALKGYTLERISDFQDILNRVAHGIG